jgi:hypothetical protein
MEGRLLKFKPFKSKKADSWWEEQIAAARLAAHDLPNIRRKTRAQLEDAQNYDPEHLVSAID